MPTDRFDELFALLPRCDHSAGRFHCQRTATKRGNWHDSYSTFCDEHAGGECDFGDEPGRDLPWGHVVRREGDRDAD